MVLGAEPEFVVSRFSDISDAQKLGSGRARSLWNLIFPTLSTYS